MTTTTPKEVTTQKNPDSLNTLEELSELIKYLHENINLEYFLEWTIICFQNFFLENYQDVEQKVIEVQQGFAGALIAKLEELFPKSELFSKINKKMKFSFIGV